MAPGRGYRRWRHLLFRQMDGKHTSCPEGAFHGDIAAVGLGDVFDDGKAQAGAAQITAAGLIHPIKSFK